MSDLLYALPPARTRPAPLTFADLVEREPELGRLQREIAALRLPLPPLPFCANQRWYGFGRYRGLGYRERVINLVGWHARSADPVVRSSRAYELVTETLYDALPDCRNCACEGYNAGEILA